MHSAIVRVVMREPENDHRLILHRVKQHINQLTLAGGIPTFEKALNVIWGILNKDSYPNEIVYDIIAYVLRIHLLSLARKEKLSTLSFQGRQLSTQEICSALYDSARKFSGIRRKLRKIANFLKPKNMQTFIDDIAATRGQSIRGEPPLTIRRAPVHRRLRTLGYA